MALGYTFDEYVEILRKYLKDEPQFNRLLSFVEENTLEQLEIYVTMGISQINIIPPIFISFDETSIQNFPIPSLVIMESTWAVLHSNSIQQARNDLSYNNGGVTVRVEDANRYQLALNELWRNLVTSREYLKVYKQSKNISQILGTSSGVPSPYACLDIYRKRYII